jgi:cupin 2 domain-containing protein
MDAGNLFADLPADLPAARAQEVLQALLETPRLRLERIVSHGQATPPGQWYDQPREEWVLLLRGGAGLRFADEAQPRTLAPGDWLRIPAHARHRVQWTAPDAPTVWLALHFEA